MRVAFLHLLLSAATATAADYAVDGRVYLSSSPDEIVSTIEVDDQGIFQFYIGVELEPLDTGQWRGLAGLEGHLDADERIMILQVQWPVGAVDIAQYRPEPDVANFIVGLGDCYLTRPLRALGVVTAMLVGDGDDMEIGLGAIPIGSSSPSSFEGQGPGWVPCTDIDELRLFESTEEGRVLYVSSTSVPNERRSFGQIKALY